MHQPELQPRPSIYHRYQVHAVAPVPAAPAEATVAVVGAGPIGLVAALELARHGVRVLLLEAEAQVSEGSRAIVFTRRSMEILHQVGVARRMAEAGLPWHCGTSFFRGQPVFRMEAPVDEDARFGPMLNLQQQVVEEYLVDAVKAQPLIELRWGHKVTAVAPRDDGVDLTVDTPQGEYLQPARWLVAADGARSAIRQMMGLRMEGAAYEGRFVIADIRIDLPYPTERRAYFDPDWNRGNTVLMHREPQGIWRIDYQLPEGETPEQALAPASIKARIDAQLAMIGHAGVPWEMDWASVYSARAMTLPEYVHGHVVFAGDAAHMLPIFGVRGANTGLQDAQNLGWKLAACVKGQGTPALLASYSTERVGAAREIIDEAGKSTRFMTPPTRGFRLLRDATLSLALTQAFVRPLLHWRTSRAHDYLDSVLNTRDDDDMAFAAGPVDGAPMADVRLADGTHLMDGMAPAFHLLVFVDGGMPLPRALTEAVADARAAGRAIVVWAVAAREGAVEGADRSIPDAGGRIRRKYGVAGGQAAYLLRPDQHVCARWGRLPGAELGAALARALGHGGDASR